MGVIVALELQFPHQIMQPDTDTYAVFGSPIEHSKSPQIHSLFAEQTGQSIYYTKVLVPVDQFRQYSEAFFKAGGKGLNVTVPFKVEAFHYASALTDRARAAQAVNTLFIRPDKTITGDNTDGIGLIHDLQTNLGWTITDQKILVLGAGGAVRGVLLPLLQCQPQKLVIANRTVEKAQQLAQTFAVYGNIETCRFTDLHEQQFDLVINATSSGLSGDLPALPNSLFNQKSYAYDMVYGDTTTPFLTWARNLGVKNLSDGLGMLVGQAAESFYLWRGIKPDIRPVLQQLRN